MDGTSINQVECWVQFQHQSTWQRACPPDLPVKTILEPPVGVLPFCFYLPVGWAAVLDDDALPAIDQASRVRLDNGDRNLRWEITLVAPTHMPSPATNPRHRWRGFVCVCVCNICLIDFNYIQRYSRRRLCPSPISSQLYTDSDESLAVRRHRSITLSKSLTSSLPIVPLSLPPV